MAIERGAGPDASPENRAVIDDPPPFLGTWPRVYAAVVVYLAALIAAFYAFTVAFRP
jgi:hypothetical protein